MFHYGGVCFIMACGVSLWWGMFHYGGVCFIMVGYVSLWWGTLHSYAEKRGSEERPG